MNYILTENEYSQYKKSIEENKIMQKNLQQIKENIRNNVECFDKEQNYYCDDCILRSTGSILIDNLCLIKKYKNFHK